MYQNKLHLRSEQERFTYCTCSRSPTQQFFDVGSRPGGDDHVHYHVHVDDARDLQTIDQIFNRDPGTGQRSATRNSEPRDPDEDHRYDQPSDQVLISLL